MRASHSRIETFNACPYKYLQRYVNKRIALPNYDASNPLILGSAMHKGIAEGVDAGVSLYTGYYPIITDLHENEIIKLEYWIPRARELLPRDVKFELEVGGPDFIGYIDAVTKNDDDTVNIYDFKYTTSQPLHFNDSPQLDLYRYFFAEEVKATLYMLIPKINIRQKNTETLEQFRARLRGELTKSKITVFGQDNQPSRVIEFFRGFARLLSATEYPKKENYNCRWCEYRELCENGEEHMMLPNSARRVADGAGRKKIWIYGVPFSGKTYLANQFDAPLMLNTDGNIKFINAPYISIADEVTTTEHTVKRKYGWEVLKDAITELEKGNHDFNTVVVDLIEDTYELCRVYMYNKLNITHESDDSFRAWDKIRIEFLTTIRRLIMLDINVVFLSHEDKTKDITKRTGEKLTAIKPNITDKIAGKLAGMVDLVGRLVLNGDTRTLSFKTDSVIFGGGRLNVQGKEISCDIAALDALYGSQPIDTKRGEPETTAAPTTPTTPAQDVPEPLPEPIPESPPRPRRIRRTVAQ